METLLILGPNRHEYIDLLYKITRGLTIVVSKEVVAPENFWSEFYSVKEDSEKIKKLSSSPCYFFVLKGNDTIDPVEQIKHAVIGLRTQYKNVPGDIGIIHASASEKEAEVEIMLFKKFFVSPDGP